jgi:putative oxidoreductase
MTVGGLLAGHGAQKLFGSFGGYGLEGTAGWLETLGLKPGKAWAALAGASELGGGALMTLGLLNPLGPIATYGAMLMAWNKAHAGKPIWVTAGGAELPLVNMAAATAVALAGSGRYSLDEALDIEVPTWLTLLTLGGVAAGFAVGALAEPEPTPAAEDTSREPLQGGGEAEQEVGTSA